MSYPPPQTNKQRQALVDEIKRAREGKPEVTVDDIVGIWQLPEGMTGDQYIRQLREGIAMNTNEPNSNLEQNRMKLEQAAPLSAEQAANEINKLAYEYVYADYETAPSCHMPQEELVEIINRVRATQPEAAPSVGNCIECNRVIAQGDSYTNGNWDDKLCGDCDTAAPAVSVEAQEAAHKVCDELYDALDNFGSVYDYNVAKPIIAKAIAAAKQEAEQSLKARIVIAEQNTDDAMAALMRLKQAERDLQGQISDLQELVFSLRCDDDNSLKEKLLRDERQQWQERERVLMRYVRHDPECSSEPHCICGLKALREGGFLGAATAPKEKQ